MNRFILLTLCVLFFEISFSQHMKMGEVMIISNSSFNREVKGETINNYVEKINPLVSKAIPQSSICVFTADRGDRKGESLLVCSLSKEKDRKTLSKDPLLDKVFAFGDYQLKDFLTKPEAYTEYWLIGADKFKTRPSISLLGIHYIKVKPERSAEFEKFVVDRLHPTVGKVLPDMQLLYYKAVAGDNTGSYITIFAIESTAARHKYWPEGAPETALVKEAFAPFNDVAKALAPYLVEGSYLLPESGGGAAIYESREWTDFVLSTQ